MEIALEEAERSNTVLDRQMEEAEVDTKQMREKTKEIEDSIAKLDDFKYSDDSDENWQKKMEER